jgi:hypothetical protein
MCKRKLRIASIFERLTGDFFSPSSGTLACEPANGGWRVHRPRLSSPHRNSSPVSRLFNRGNVEGGDAWKTSILLSTVPSATAPDSIGIFGCSPVSRLFNRGNLEGGDAWKTSFLLSPVPSATAPDSIGIFGRSPVSRLFNRGKDRTRDERSRRFISSRMARGRDVRAVRGSLSGRTLVSIRPRISGG